MRLSLAAILKWVHGLGHFKKVNQSELVGHGRKVQCADYHEHGGNANIGVHVPTTGDYNLPNQLATTQFNQDQLTRFVKSLKNANDVLELTYEQLLNDSEGKVGREKTAGCFLCNTLFGRCFATSMSLFGY